MFRFFKTYFTATPRIYLFFPAIILKLLASALSGAAFVTNSGPLFASGTLVWAAWFVLLFVIARPQTDKLLKLRTGLLKPAAIAISTVLIALGVAECAGMLSVNWSNTGEGQDSPRMEELVTALHNSFAYNDGTALCHQAIDNLLAGENPYAHSNIIAAGIEFGSRFDKITPVRTGAFADEFPYPDMDRLRSVWDEAIKTPDIIPPEIESRLNYPAGCFLLPAPFVALGLTDVRLIYLLLLIPVIGYILYLSPPRFRLWLLAGFLASLEVWNGIASGETGTLYFPFLLLGWVLLRRKLWVSALMMGLAVAIKQVPWFFLPFYLILAYHTYGLKKFVTTAGIIGMLFVAVNLAFIVADPALWLDSVLAPTASGFFPLGVGLVSFVSGGYLHLESPFWFTLMELAVGVAAIAWYWFKCRRYPHAGLILAVLPLFFAWRSLWPYFFYFDLILLAAVIVDEYGSRNNETGAKIEAAGV